MPKTKDFFFYRPTDGHGLPEDPVPAIVAPRPIGWISTCEPNGSLNLAPYSYFNIFNLDPPILGFACVGTKDTLRNVERTGEFAWSLVTRDLAPAMHKTSETVPPEEDEFALAGLTPAPSRLITIPRVAESPVSFECRLSQILQLQTSGGARVKTWLVFGEVLGVHIMRKMLKDGLYDTASHHPVLCGGDSSDLYFDITPETVFRIFRDIQQ